MDHGGGGWLDGQVWSIYSDTSGSKVASKVNESALANHVSFLVPCFFPTRLTLLLPLTHSCERPFHFFCFPSFPYQLKSILFPITHVVAWGLSFPTYLAARCC